MAKQKYWQKMRPDSNEKLERALKSEKTLQAIWYAKMSGKVPWHPGERERLNAMMDAMTAEVNALVAANLVRVFASLPEE